MEVMLTKGKSRRPGGYSELYQALATLTPGPPDPTATNLPNSPSYTDFHLMFTGPEQQAACSTPRSCTNANLRQTAGYIPASYTTSITAAKVIT